MPARFDVGRMFITPGALEGIGLEEVLCAIRRHVRGDWGDLDDEDRKSNEQALVVGERIFSSYKSAQGLTFWIITERDRSVTTVLLPSDY